MIVHFECAKLNFYCQWGPTSWLFQSSDGLLHYSYLTNFPLILFKAQFSVNLKRTSDSEYKTKQNYDIYLCIESKHQPKIDGVMKKMTKFHQKMRDVEHPHIRIPCNRK